MQLTALSTMLVLAATHALAEPIPLPERSQHPRTGPLAELVFEHDSDELQWTAYRELGRVAAWVDSGPTGVVVIEGYASKRGSARHNLELSLRRGTSVQRVLVDAGVPAERMIVAAFGEHGIQRGHNRRVAVWSTRASRDDALAVVRARGAVIVVAPKGETAATTRR